MTRGLSSTGTTVARGLATNGYLLGQLTGIIRERCDTFGPTPGEARCPPRPSGGDLVKKSAIIVVTATALAGLSVGSASAADWLYYSVLDAGAGKVG